MIMRRNMHLLIEKEVGISVWDIRLKAYRCHLKQEFPEPFCLWIIIKLCLETQPWRANPPDHTQTDPRPADTGLAPPLQRIRRIYPERFVTWVGSWQTTDNMENQRLHGAPPLHPKLEFVPFTQLCGNLLEVHVGVASYAVRVYKECEGGEEMFGTNPDTLDIVWRSRWVEPPWQTATIGPALTFMFEENWAGINKDETQRRAKRNLHTSRRRRAVSEQITPKRVSRMSDIEESDRGRPRTDNKNVACLVFISLVPGSKTIFCG